MKVLIAAIFALSAVSAALAHDDAAIAKRCHLDEKSGVVHCH
jgi:hypothetical protein